MGDYEEELKKIQLVSEAASILLLDANSLRSIGTITLALQGLIVQMSLEEIERLQPELQLIFGTIKNSQKQVQKTGTAQHMFIENLKEYFGIGEGKPKNVRKGNVRKKD